MAWSLAALLESLANSCVSGRGGRSRTYLPPMGQNSTLEAENSLHLLVVFPVGSELKTGGGYSYLKRYGSKNISGSITEAGTRIIHYLFCATSCRIISTDWEKEVPGCQI